VKVQEVIDEFMIDCCGRNPRHELLDDEADLLGVDYRFGWDWPACLTSKPFGEDDRLTSKGTAIGRAVPPHNDRSAIGSKELVRSGFAAAELTHVAEWLPCHL
jgi:hypothetical protein